MGLSFALKSEELRPVGRNWQRLKWDWMEYLSSRLCCIWHSIDMEKRAIYAASIHFLQIESIFL
jgi:hypothetical protein